MCLILFRWSIPAFKENRLCPVILCNFPCRTKIYNTETAIFPKHQVIRCQVSVQDMFRLPYADESFDVIIVANALHIVPEPEKALSEIRRVLRDDGVLVAPTFTHADNAFFGTAKAFFMKLAGFPLHSKWTSADYLSFLRENGWTVRKSTVLKTSFPLTYAECVKSEG